MVTRISSRFAWIASVAAPAALGASCLVGCSSSSGGASPSDGGNPEAAVGANEAGTDGGLPESSTSTLTLVWSITPVSAPGAGGAYVASEAGAEGGNGEAGSAEAGTSSDGGAEGGEGTLVDAGTGSETSAPIADAAAAGDGSVPGLEGVMVCVYQNSAIPCTTTAADGTFTLTGLPIRTNINLTLNKTGYSPQLIAMQTASTDMDGRADPIYMTPTTANPYLPVTVDFQNKGQVGIFVLGQSPTNGTGFVGDPGATLTLTPTVPAADGPYFTTTNNEFVPGATSIVDSLGYYYNLTPGTYTLTLGDPNNDCEPISFSFGGWGYPVTTPAHSLQFPIVAGYITGVVGMICTPNSVVVAVDGG